MYFKKSQRIQAANFLQDAADDLIRCFLIKSASRTKVREATNRGSTLFYHSRKAIDAGHSGGFHIPRAPGRTSQAPSAGTLAAGDAPSLLFG